jgi:hypothetical protein
MDGIDVQVVTVTLIVDDQTKAADSWTQYAKNDVHGMQKTGRVECKTRVHPITAWGHERGQRMWVMARTWVNKRRRHRLSSAGKARVTHQVNREKSTSRWRRHDPGEHHAQQATTATATATASHIPHPATSLAHAMQPPHPHRDWKYGLQA